MAERGGATPELPLHGRAPLVPAPSAARPSRRGRSTGDITRERIMRQAQRLFAQRGIDAVSLNEIIVAAKVNSAAIHYHFRSKDGLIEALLRRGASRLGDRRAEILDNLEARGRITVRDLVAVMVEPIEELKAMPGGLDYARFIASVSLHPHYSEFLAEVTNRYTTRLLALLERLTPGLPDDVRVRRFAYAQTFAYHAIASDDRTVEVWMQVHGYATDEVAATKDLIDLLSGGLAARVPKARKASGSAAGRR